MLHTYVTWNTQGIDQEKWSLIKGFSNRADVIFLQEASGLAEDYPAERGHHQVDGLFVYGWSGKSTDGYANNRVSLAIVSTFRADTVGFVYAVSRGLGYITSGSLLLGTWHEKSGQGGLGGCLNDLTMQRFGRHEVVLTTDSRCIIGGDFNTERRNPVVVGSDRNAITPLNSASYNVLHSLTPTHKNGKNLDRIFASNGMSIVHHWAEPVAPSDHNPVFATIAFSPAQLNCWDRFRVGLG